MRISTEFTKSTVEERLYFDPKMFDAEMRVAAFALQKFGAVTEGGMKAQPEDSDMAANLQADLGVMRQRVNRGYPSETAFYADREATLIEDAVRKLGQLPLEGLAEAEAYMRDRAAEMIQTMAYGPADGAVPESELVATSASLLT